MSNLTKNKRIAKNALLLYFRSLLTMAISLYTSRVILHNLGFRDFGIISLVGGVVAMFQMFSATFVSATQRFLNFEMGRGNLESVRNVFSVSLTIHVVLALILLILFETVGIWFLEYQLSIPLDKVYATRWAYQFSVFTFLINMISIPYNAVIVANEKMNIFAYVSIYEAIANLSIALLIASSPIDKLIFYSFMLFVVALSIRVFYGLYCSRNFIESRYVRVHDKKIYIKILSLSGWTFLGSSASILTINGMGIILNIFTGVVVNSAKGIAGKVEGVINQLVGNFMIALRPQLTKSYASGDNQYLISLISRGSRYSFYLTLVLCLPFVFYAGYILTLWLGKYPIYADNFVSATALYSISIPLSTILDILLLAKGNMKRPQIVLSILEVLNLPFSCMILYLNFKPYYIYASYIVLFFLSLCVRLYYVDKYGIFSVQNYINWVIKKILIVSSVVIVSAWLIANCTILNNFMKIIFSELVLVVIVASIGMTHNERTIIFKKISKNVSFKK